jgi:taurine dioxygenase
MRNGRKQVRWVLMPVKSFGAGELDHAGLRGVVRIAASTTMSFYQDFNDKQAIEAWHARPRAPFRTLELKPLAPTLGAEIRGVDLSRPLSDEQFGEIKRAMSEYLVLAFRDQKLDSEQHKQFARRFGTLHRHVLAKARAIAGGTDDPEILAWRTGAESRFTAGDGWHNDVSCDAAPIWASFLRVTRLPEGGGGDTAFSNMILAYESLSPAYKAFLDTLTAVHDGALAWTAGYGSKPEPGKTFPASEHPVVARHPVTGQKFLYVNASFTTHIVQLQRDESQAVLQQLFRHVEKHLSFQVRVHWEPNTLLLWDNWATQHHAVWDYFPEERWGERVSACLEHGPQA